MGGAHTARDAGTACKDCPDPPAPGKRRCKPCAKAHSAREADRRAQRREAGKCTVCGARAVKVGGVALTTCAEHREYYRARAAGE